MQPSFFFFFFFFHLNYFCLLPNKWGDSLFLRAGQIVCGSRRLLLDKGASVNGGCNWNNLKKKKKSFCLHPLCSCSCLCPSSLDVVQWPRRCWVKGLLGSLWPSTLASLWESWWLCTWRGECQVKRSTLTHTQLTCVTIINHPLLNYHVYYWLFWRSCSSLLLLFH